MKIVNVSQYQKSTYDDINNISKFIYETVLKDFAYYIVSKADGTPGIISDLPAVVQDTGTSYIVKINPCFIINSTGEVLINPAQQSLNLNQPGSSARIDIIQADYIYTNQTLESKSFINPLTAVITSQDAYTEKLIDMELEVKEGIEGSGIAPTVDTDKVKICEIYVDTTGGIGTADIYNVDSDFGAANTGWTTETTGTIFLRTIQDHRTLSTLDHPDASVTTNKIADENVTYDKLNSDVVTALDLIYSPITKGVTNGDTHDHVGGDGAQINHTSISNIGTNTHAQIDTFIGTKAQANGLASLDGSSLVVQNPANATATPTAGKIPIADGSGKLDGWISPSPESILTGSGAPASTPTFVGQRYVDTTNTMLYIAFGTSSSADWQINYPPGSIIMGQQRSADFAIDIAAANFLYGVLFTALASSIVTKLTINFNTVTDGGKLVMGIYSHDATNNKPDTLLCQTSEITLSTTNNADNDQMKILTITNPIALMQGTNYWIAIHVDQNTYPFSLSSTKRSKLGRYVSLAYNATLPATWGGSATDYVSYNVSALR